VQRFEIRPLAFGEPRYARAGVATRGEPDKRNPSKTNLPEARVFVREGLRSYRKSYDVREVYWGAGVGAGLVAVVGWVGYRGAHPDPSLMDMSAALQAEPAGSARPLENAAPGARAAPLGGAAQAPEGSVEVARASSAERGALPSGLSAAGFAEGKLGAYLPDTLYVKINGRAEFYLSFGVQSLHAVTLEGPAGASVDIELYDLGESRNALGCYNGERPPGMDSVLENGSTFRFDRNAAFLARGRYYVRFVGSDESAAVLGEVRRLLELFRRELVGEELPWGFALFVDQLKLAPSAVGYLRENAFSFGFARDVYKASLSPADSQEDMEAFVSVKADAAAAERAALEYQAAFRSQGVPAGKTADGLPLSKDEFLGSVSTATSVERWVIGVRGAPSVERLSQTLAQLRAGLRAAPAAVLARAVPSPEASGEAEPRGEAVAGPSGESAAGPSGETPAEPPAGAAPARPAEAKTLEGEDQ